MRKEALLGLMSMARVGMTAKQVSRPGFFAGRYVNTIAEPQPAISPGPQGFETQEKLNQFLTRIAHLEAGKTNYANVLTIATVFLGLGVGATTYFYKQTEKSIDKLDVDIKGRIDKLDADIKVLRTEMNTGFQNIYTLMVQQKNQSVPVLNDVGSAPSLKR